MNKKHKRFVVGREDWLAGKVAEWFVGDAFTFHSPETQDWEEDAGKASKLSLDDAMDVARRASQWDSGQGGRGIRGRTFEVLYVPENRICSEVILTCQNGVFDKEFGEIALRAQLAVDNDTPRKKAAKNDN